MTLKTFLITYNQEHKYTFYIGFDRGDRIFDQSGQQLHIQRFVSIMKNTSIKFIPMENITKGHLTKMWNALFKRAYDDGCEYFYQCGDDIEFKTPGWVNASISKLAESNDIGMTGPINNNSRLLTQSFVSRRHMDLFGYYFPEEILNWFCDDWINEIYKKIGHFYPLLNHFSINMGGNPRYVINNDEKFKNNFSANFSKMSKYCTSLVDRDYMRISDKLYKPMPTEPIMDIIPLAPLPIIESTNTAYICGCVFNCGKYLSQVFENIRRLVSLFHDVRIIVSYDHSEDNSLTLLKQCQQEKWLGDPRKMIIIENPPELRTHIRTQNISNARNVIINYIRNKNDDAFQSNTMIMMDMDDVCATPIKTSVITEMLERDDWDSVSFNRSDYYDIWALSINTYVYSCWHWDYPTKVVEIMKSYITKLLYHAFIHSKESLIVCDSAFNGFALYRLEKFIDCNYEWEIKKNIDITGEDKILLNRIMLDALVKEEISKILLPKDSGESSSTEDIQFDFHPEKHNGSDCEHRFFHMEATRKNGARIRISPISVFE
jgi:hypothetical protein